MFGNSLILVLLGCALASAIPIQGLAKPAPQPRNDLNTLDLMLKGTHNQIKKNYLETIQQFKKTYNALVEANKKTQKYSTDKIEQLRSNFHEVVNNGWETLYDTETSILRGRTRNLQGAVEYLSIMLSKNNIKQVNQETNQNAKPEQETANKENQKPQEIVENQTNNNIFNPWQNSWLYLKNKAKQSASIKRAQNVNDGVQDSISDNLNIFNGNLQIPGNQFIPEGLNTMTQGFGMVGGALGNFENQMQETINGGNNLLNPFGSPANTLANEVIEVIDNNINNSKQTLNILARQYTQTVSDAMTTIKRNLQGWKNEVDNFLVNGKNNSEQPNQPEGEGNTNTPGQGTIIPGGFFPPIMPQLNFPSIPGGIIPTNLPGVNDGTFKNFGQRVGGGIGEGVDNAFNTFGSFFRNPVNILGK